MCLELQIFERLQIQNFLAKNLLHVYMTKEGKYLVYLSISPSPSPCQNGGFVEILKYKFLQLLLFVFIKECSWVQSLISKVKSWTDWSVFWSKWPEVLNAWYCYLESKVQSLGHYSLKLNFKSCHKRMVLIGILFANPVRNGGLLRVAQLSKFGTIWQGNCFYKTIWDRFDQACGKHAMHSASH